MASSTTPKTTTNPDPGGTNDPVPPNPDPNNPWDDGGPNDPKPGKH